MYKGKLNSQWNTFFFTLITITTFLPHLSFCNFPTFPTLLYLSIFQSLKSLQSSSSLRNTTTTNHKRISKCSPSPPSSLFPPSSPASPHLLSRLVPLAEVHHPDPAAKHLFLNQRALQQHKHARLNVRPTHLASLSSSAWSTTKTSACSTPSLHPLSPNNPPPTSSPTTKLALQFQLLSQLLRTPLAATRSSQSELLAVQRLQDLAARLLSPNQQALRLHPLVKLSVKQMLPACHSSSEWSTTKTSACSIL